MAKIVGIGSKLRVWLLKIVVKSQILSFRTHNETISPNGGQITWGGVDTTNCDPNINYVPLSAKSYWQFTLSSFTFGTYSMNKNAQAISSTGNTEIGLPSAVTMAWLPLVNGTFDTNSTDYFCSCQIANFPAMVFQIGGMMYSIPASEYTTDVRKILKKSLKNHKRPRRDA